VANRVNYISNARLSVDWQWGLEPFSRLAPPALVSLSDDLASSHFSALPGLIFQLLKLCFSLPALELSSAERRGRRPGGQGV
jgi:hypothetical protein